MSLEISGNKIVKAKIVESIENSLEQCRFFTNFAPRKTDIPFFPIIYAKHPQYCYHSTRRPW